MALVVAVLGFFGVETTTFAALVAAGGVAIGVAWGGLLANFAAGAFLVFPPSVQGRRFRLAPAASPGRSKRSASSARSINTPDNVHTIVGNNRVFAETIQNFSTNPYAASTCRGDLRRRNHRVAIRMLKDRLAAVAARAGKREVPTVDVLEFAPAGPKLCVRPLLPSRALLGRVLETNRLIREAFSGGRLPCADADVCGERRRRRSSARHVVMTVQMASCR